MKALRHHCRNPRCRMKLKEPVENQHHAFCTRGCYESFYLRRCLVCEDQMRRRRSNQRIKSGHGKCASEYRRFPRVFDYLVTQDGQSPDCAHEGLRSAHSTGLKIGLRTERPRHRALRQWSWHSDELEHELRDAAGTLLGRVESNGGRHRLTYPVTFPIMSWADLAEAKHRAESIALAHLKLVVGVNIEAGERGRINAANTRPNPMGAPMNLQLSAETVIASDWRPTTGIAPEIPEFLRRGTVVPAHEAIGTPPVR